MNFPLVKESQTSFWDSKLGYKDSNLEMTESESVALPFGDSPMFCVVPHNKMYYISLFLKMQVLF